MKEPAKAKSLLRRFVPFHDLKLPVKAEAIHVVDRILVIKLPVRKFTCVSSSGFSWSGDTIDGVISGYNLHAPSVVLALARFRWCSCKEAHEWIGWWKKAREKANRDSDLCRLKDLASDLGYRVTKLPGAKDGRAT